MTITYLIVMTAGIAFGYLIASLHYRAKLRDVRTVLGEVSAALGEKCRQFDQADGQVRCLWTEQGKRRHSAWKPATRLQVESVRATVENGNRVFPQGNYRMERRP